METSRRSNHIVPLVAIALIGLYFYLVLFSLTPRFIPFTEDLSFSFEVVSRISVGEFPLLGPPSHTGGRHLGPVYYYYLWLAQVVGGGDTYRTIVVAVFGLALAPVFLIGALRQLHRQNNHLCAALLGLLCLQPEWIRMVRDPWHAHLLLLCISMTLYFWARWIRGTDKSSSWLIVSSVLTVLTHYASVPALGALWSVGILCWWRETTPSERCVQRILCGDGWRVTIIAGFLVLLMMTPLALYELRYGGNLNDLLRGQAMRSLLSPSTVAIFFSGLLTKFSVHSGLLASLGVIFIVLTARLAYPASLVTLIALLGYSTSALRLGPQLYDYFFICLFPMWILALSAACHWNGHSARRIFVGFFILLTCVNLAQSHHRLYKPPRLYSFHSLRHVLAFQRYARKHPGAQIVTDSASYVMKVPYQLAMRDLASVHYWDRMKELKIIPVEQKDLMIIACPPIWSQRISELESQYQLRERVAQKISPRSLRIDSPCFMRRYAH